jgi:hypothetical protein
MSARRGATRESRAMRAALPGAPALTRAPLFAATDTHSLQDSASIKRIEPTQSYQVRFVCHERLGRGPNFGIFGWSSISFISSATPRSS